MTIDPAILDAMLAAGASAEVIVAAVKADAAREQAHRAAQRAGNAQRQRRYRERLYGAEMPDLFDGVAADGTEPAIAPAPDDDAGNASPAVTDGVTDVIPPSLDKSPRTPKINPNPRVPVGSRARGPAPEAIAPETAGARFPCPAGCDPGDWRDLLVNRRARRLAMTPAAYRKLLRDLAAHADDAWPPGRLLAHAAEKGWAQIFDPRDDHPQGARRHGHAPSRSAAGPARDPGAPHNPLVRAVLRSEARGVGGGGTGF